jgi:hypothetical protein
MSELSTDMQDAPSKKDNRMLAIGLAVGAALCLIYAASTQQWLANSSRFVDIGFGLFSNHECTVSSSWSARGEVEQTYSKGGNAEFIERWRRLGPEAQKLASSAFAPAGKVTFVLIVLAALGLLVAAGLAYARKTPDLPVAPTTIALLAGMLGLISGCVFVATKPGPAGMVGVGSSFWLFGVGSVIAIVSAQLLARVNRPPDTEWTAE